ncbi:TAXI family TRAP transporter solute-binding subunit [Piscinibacter sp. HJYY11]|uniref:TAXI family TRAP transporter solute-binding subunit n=1 Tax=Piscinibacter sp. HJYY11 TaxID=2801333 RepID=UPI00191E905B|nr:TAXI family TRAP transporter solute-binding subunit [Piscinibacter sp. HJYY11]MBL0730768.1 ABC transporter substrate-binding protein [Piscinibacter sp. HJYY11]
MPKVLRNTLLSARDLLATAGPFLLLALALLVVAYWVLDPTPPRKVVLATGVDQGAYAEFGKRYVQFLQQHGITVELRPTNGAAENLRLLRDPASGVDIAFVQGGADERDRRPAEEEEDSLVSLGSLFYEPVWIFYREDSAKRLLKADSLTSLAQLPGWKLNIGARGSGVPNLMRRLLEANKVDTDTITLLRNPQTPAVQGLLEGNIDAVTFASAPESVMVQMLLQTPGIKLFSFSQADAYSRRFAFLSPVTLPRGVVDLAADMPPADVHLVAPTATLVARQGTHPALIQLFVQAAQQIHGEAGWFQRKGDFPSIKGTERPVADEAQRFYAKGPPFLQRFLPFWLANLVDRMWVALLSIVAILIPLSRVLPPLYEFRIRSRVFRWYGRLRVVEDAQGQRPATELLKELDDIERSVEQVSVPLSYADELYALRSHIQLVRGRLEVARTPP